MNARSRECPTGTGQPMRTEFALVASTHVVREDAEREVREHQPKKASASQVRGEATAVLANES